MVLFQENAVFQILILLMTRERGGISEECRTMVLFSLIHLAFSVQSWDAGTSSRHREMGECGLPQ